MPPLSFRAPLASVSFSRPVPPPSKAAGRQRALLRVRFTQREKQKGPGTLSIFYASVQCRHPFAGGGPTPPPETFEKEGKEKVRDEKKLDLNNSCCCCCFRLSLSLSLCISRLFLLFFFFFFFFVVDRSLFLSIIESRSPFVRVEQLQKKGEKKGQNFSLFLTAVALPLFHFFCFPVPPPPPCLSRDVEGWLGPRPPASLASPSPSQGSSLALYCCLSPQPTQRRTT